LPSDEIKDRMASLAVGLASDCDSPENDVSKLMQANLAGAKTLPFVGFVTHDGKWVAGYSGYKDAAAFLEIVKTAEESPYLKATPAVQKKLAALAARAGKAAERDDWKTVLKAAADAAKTTGRCPERDALAALVKKARAWAAVQLDEVVKAARSGGDLTAARKVLEDVRRQFAREPEADDAADGIKALKRLGSIVAAEASGNAASGIREKAARDCEGTRWAAIFDESAPEEKPADEESTDIEEGG